MYGKMKEHLSQYDWLKSKKPASTKRNDLIESAQQAAITVKGKEVLNFCANNYLGLSNHPRLIKASQEDDGPSWIWYVLCSFHLRNTRYT